MFFLGPSLDLAQAQSLYPEACYHPPIQCGDIIRLFRLNPQRIIIIDGLYETTPATWHKELLLALEYGIEVWGAASMGALRAAELHHYGMQGFGLIFNEFKEGILSDDDEVAVLHQSQNEGYHPLNDAMVNIRATCQKAYEEQIITPIMRQELITYCKAQFYPYRSLVKAALSLAKSSSQEYLLFVTWLEEHGVVDVKKQDAVEILKHASKHPIVQHPQQTYNSMTCFLRELLLFANTTPFQHHAEWLPPIEKELHVLQHSSPAAYMLLAEIASFMQKLVTFLAPEQELINNEALEHYIQNNALYDPGNDFIVYKNHSSLSGIYSLICQSICLVHLNSEQLDEQVKALAYYYDLSAENSILLENHLRIIMVLIVAINQQTNNSNLHVSKNYVRHHLQQLKNWRQYTPSRLKEWLANPPVSSSFFTQLIHHYLMASSVHALSSVTVDYYHWIYDAYASCMIPYQSFDSYSNLRLNEATTT